MEKSDERYVRVSRFGALSHGTEDEEETYHNEPSTREEPDNARDGGEDVEHAVMRKSSRRRVSRRKVRFIKDECDGGCKCECEEEVIEDVMNGEIGQGATDPSVHAATKEDDVTRGLAEDAKVDKSPKECRAKTTHAQLIKICPKE